MIFTLPASLFKAIVINTKADDLAGVSRSYICQLALRFVKEYGLQTNLYFNIYHEYVYNHVYDKVKYYYSPPSYGSIEDVLINKDIASVIEKITSLFYAVLKDFQNTNLVNFSLVTDVTYGFQHEYCFTLPEPTFKSNYYL